MKSYERILLQNQAWARAKKEGDPHFFSRLETIQTPEFLWIGCSDSRVPADQITGTQPGEIFVHRNIANLVVHSDINLLSVLEYAVNHLKVKHIIVCGHYGCGGVKAAMSHHHLGIINNWVRSIKDVHRIHRELVDSVPDPEKQLNLMIELTIKEQVMNLAKTSIIQRAWKHEQRPHLHGWVYGLGDGVIHPISEMAPGTHIDSLYEFDDL